MADPVDSMFSKRASAADGGEAPLSGSRAQTVQRLQVGLSGLAAMMLIVGLANIIQQRAKVSEAAAVPEAVSTMAVQPGPSPASDPLADAGVVPDLASPAGPTPTPSGTNMLPESGDVPATRPQD